MVSQIYKLAIVSTHPIQYNAPLYAMLSQRKRIQVKVFYTWGAQVLKNKYDPGFGKTIQWDIPLLEGYEYMFVKNVATDPGSHHFNGINNPTLIDDIIMWKADALLIYGWSFKSHLKAMRFFHGKIPILFRGDSTLINKKNWLKKRIRTILLRWVYSNVDTALYVGTYNKLYFKSTGLRESQLVFAPHAVDNDRFKIEAVNSTERVNGWREMFGVKDNDLIFLYAGKLDENKNVQLLLDAFNSINTNDIHLVIAGNGPSEVILKNKFQHVKNIHFVPFQNQQAMPALYSLADVFVLPSISETWGLSINEAMACGRAVLVSSGCAAAIDLDRDGFFLVDCSQSLGRNVPKSGEEPGACSDERFFVGGWHSHLFIGSACAAARSSNSAARGEFATLHR